MDKRHVDRKMYRNCALKNGLLTLLHVKDLRISDSPALNAKNDHPRIDGEAYYISAQWSLFSKAHFSEYLTT